MKKIEINGGKKKELMRVCNATYPTVRQALRFLSDTEKAKRIRKVAMEMGGMVMEEV